MAKAFDRVSEFWAKASAPDYRAQHTRTNWMGHIEVGRHINRACTDSAERVWVEYFRETYLAGRRAASVLNLGCGEGALERDLVARDFADSYTGYDLSGPCIERANDTVGREHPRARFVQADLNHVELPRGEFEVAFFSHSLHHIERLEHLCEETRAALQPGGFLLVNEFIGPTRMQWTQKQMSICNRLLDALSESLRLDVTRLPERVPKAPVARLSHAEWLRCDPSECVRSADIIPVLTQSFEILERRDFGGTVLQKMLENVVGNFDEANDDHSTIIRLLITFESMLIEEGVLPSDFTFIIARPRML
jgi:SAM-dependent methyltransferase